MKLEPRLLTVNVKVPECLVQPVFYPMGFTVTHTAPNDFRVFKVNMKPKHRKDNPFITEYLK